MKGETRQWLRDTRGAVFSGDASRIAEQFYYAYSGAWLSLTSRHPVGTNVFSKDWDALIVLDACRVDALREVAPEYSFIDTVESIWSVGSTSAEWYMNTFVPEHQTDLAETAMISANPNAEAILLNRDHPPRHPTPFLATDWNTVSADELDYVEFTRQHDRPYGNKSDSGSPPMPLDVPDYVTDRAIVAGRKGHENLLVHYFQPHRPFIHDFIKRGTELSYIEREPYEAGRSGLASKEDLWPLFVDNLRLVLDSVGELLTNLDAEKVAITADHGELLGELGQYGHFQSIPHPNLKRVPWVETTATDCFTRHPDEEFTIGERTSVRDQLRELGYV